jgi:putative N6-adenine-specific DNA methylase
MAWDVLRLFAAAAPGIEPLLESEARGLGFVDATAEPGGVSFSTDARGVARAHLGLGLAHSIRLRVADFDATRFDRLERAGRSIEWEAFYGAGDEVDVRAHARSSRLYHTGAIQERVADALVSRTGANIVANAAHTVFVRVVSDHFTVSIDLSGEPLHRRGYRHYTGKAPLREDLARALVLVSGWDRTSRLVDPMMGSGTIPIEAAILAYGLAPGRSREFAFSSFPMFERRLVAAERAKFDEQALTHEVPIFGSDRDAGAVEHARGNAERAQLPHSPRFDHAPLSRAPGLAEPLPESGALVVNPPYGRRIGRENALDPLYRALGARIASLPPGFHAAVAAADTRLPRLGGSSLESVLMTDHGGTKIRFFVRPPIAP